MGRRDEPELTPTDEELAAAEASLRRTLARYDEPAPVAPPPNLAARVLASLPANPPGRQRAAPALPRLAPAAGWAAATFAALLLALGSWGVLLNSHAPAAAAGGPGQLLLVLTLAAKPIVNLLVSAGAAAALVALAAAVGAWLWWRIVSSTPFAVPVEIPR